MRNTTTGLREFPDFFVIDMDGVCKPQIVAQPAMSLHPVHRAKPKTFERVMLLISGLTQVGV